LMQEDWKHAEKDRCRGQGADRAVGA
jgi:hypothetical protein